MSEFPDKDPQLSFNGAPASEEDLLVLENLASSLAELIPTVEARSYGYMVDDAFMIFQTWDDTDPDGDGSLAGIAILDSNQKDRLALKYDQSNNLHYLGIEENDDLNEICGLIQTFLNSEKMDPGENALARYVQNFLKVLMSETAEEAEETYLALPNSGERARVVDLIQQKVHDKTTGSIHAHEYGIILEDGFTLSILKQDVIGLFGEDDAVDYLPLQISLVDEAKRTVYTYHRSIGGKVALYVSVGVEVLEDEEETDEEEALDAFRQEMGFDKPTKHDVDLLISKLVDASVVDTSISDSNSDW